MPQCTRTHIQRAHQEEGSHLQTKEKVPRKIPLPAFNTLILCTCGKTNICGTCLPVPCRLTQTPALGSGVHKEIEGTGEARQEVQPLRLGD